MSKPFLTPAWRKALLALHIVAGVGWMGFDVALGILLFTAKTTADGSLAASCYTAVALVVPPVLPALSLGMLSTGLALGLGTAWGLLRYWWVAIKLVMAIVMTALVFFLLVPSVSGMSAPEAGASAEAVRAALGRLPTQLLFPPVVSFLMLAFAVGLSVFKPWGRIRKSAKPAA